jgi:ArsR family transcriptional regulator
MITTAEQRARADVIFKALASGVRRQIITILATGEGAEDSRCCGDEVCACVFSEKLGLGAPTVSHHMKTLLEAGLVVAEKRGLWVYYRLAPRAIADVTDAVAALSGGAPLDAGTEGRSSCC